MAKTKLPASRKSSSRKSSTTTAKSTKKKASRAAVPQPVGYSGTPLLKKLGIKPDTVLTLLGEPSDFLQTLGPLPPNVKIRKTAIGDRDLTVWFPRNLAELKRRIKAIADKVDDGGLWIAWPKKSSGVDTDLTQEAVRQQGLEQGIVDHKLGAIDQTFSDLRFANRKK